MKNILQIKVILVWNTCVSISLFFIVEHMVKVLLWNYSIYAKDFNQKPCCAVIKDTSCKMSSMLTGQIRITKLLVDEFDGYNDECESEIIMFITARCLNFLIAKFPMVHINVMEYQPISSKLLSNANVIQP